MATCPVRFHFACDLEPCKLHFIHNVPRSLIRADAPKDPEYTNSFVNAVMPITLEHYAVCYTASDTKCVNCRAPTAKVLQTPISWLHIDCSPFVRVHVNPVFGKAQCEMVTRQQISTMIYEVVQEHRPGGAAGAAGPIELIPCKICGQLDGVKKCTRCKAVAYCGKEHQKEDRKMHKKICTPPGPAWT